MEVKVLLTLDAGDLLACFQELLDGDHSVVVLVHFLENATHVSKVNLKALC